jgi:hypothetical protein
VLRHADLPDVVQQCAVGDGLEVLATQADVRADTGRVMSQPATVMTRLRSFASTALANAATICVARSRLVMARRRRMAERMRASSSYCWTGFARKSSAPASSAATMSPGAVWAVMTMTGSVAVIGSARSWRQIS